jgi:hypothetical protein
MKALLVLLAGHLPATRHYEGASRSPTSFHTVTMQTLCLHLSRVTSLLLILSLLNACSYSTKKTRQTNLPHGNNVEYRNGAKILTQRFADRDDLSYYLSDLKLRPKLSINGTSETNHSFEIGSSGSCKLSAPPPQKLVFELIHDVANRKVWHFPPPKPSQDFSKPNASVDLSIMADGQTFKVGGHFQSNLKKDEPSDATFYETLITEISREDFTRIANSHAVKINLGPLISFDLDEQTIAVLKYFAETVNDTEPWP